MTIKSKIEKLEAHTRKRMKPRRTWICSTDAEVAKAQKAIKALPPEDLPPYRPKPRIVRLVVKDMSGRSRERYKKGL